MDGAVGFTQSPIESFSNFTYEFRIADEQHGTFWYHAHSQSQRGDGLFGGLIIHRSVGTGLKYSDYKDDLSGYGNTREILLMIGDWYHQSADEMLEWFTSAKSFGNEVHTNSSSSSDDKRILNFTLIACTRFCPHKRNRKFQLLKRSSSETAQMR